MRICLISSLFLPITGGGESYIHTIANVLASLNQNVFVITGTLNSDKAESKETNRFNSLYSTIRLPYFRDFCEGKGDFYQASIIIYRTLIELKPDIIHAQDPLALLLVSMVSKNIKVPIFFTFHWTFEHWEKESVRFTWGTKSLSQSESLSLEKSLLQFIFQNCGYKKLICVGNKFKQWALELGANKTDIVVIPNSVDIDFFYPKQMNIFVKQKLGFLEGDKIILTPARIVQKKGIIDIVRSLQFLNYNFKLLIAGSEPPYRYGRDNYVQQVFEEIEFLNLKNRVNIMKVSLLNMPDLYSLSDLVALPSYSEGLSTVILEAMACGKPIIASNISANQEIIEHGTHGLLFKLGSPRELAECINKLTSDQPLSQALISHGIKLVRKKYNAKTNIQKILNLYGNFI